jgi:hypothetical protein
VDQFARFSLGYHGCDPGFADDLIWGRVAIRDWKPSRNPYDWLGEGMYFWEYGPERARTWGTGGVVGAIIQLGTCLDLTDTRYMDLLADEYQALRRSYRARHLKLPRNHGPGSKLRDLDALVINTFTNRAEETSGLRFQTVRAPFLEGNPIFPGSGILRESHIQISVRDPACIIGVFRPNLA